MFVDRVTIRLFAGRGGNGVVAWRREKYIPKGGPCGGNGGDGGSVVLMADRNEHSLEWFHMQGHAHAEHGGQGGSNSRHGKTGKNLLLKVPCGTLVKDAETGEVLFDLVEDKQKVIVCQGGRGGRGNETFKSPTNRAPRECTPGTPGEERQVELELKLIADVGLVGFPNAGKSTLINALAKLRVKTGAYPFTTLKPNLGYMTQEDTRKKVLLADVPGLIEGASQNRGLGFEFLRHIERTKMLVYVLDSSGIDERLPSDDFRILQNELRCYQPELLERPFIVLLNKIDTPESEELIEDFVKQYPELDSKIYRVSALEKEGLDTVKDQICAMIKALEPVEG